MFIFCIVRSKKVILNVSGLQMWQMQHLLKIIYFSANFTRIMILTVIPYQIFLTLPHKDGSTVRSEFAYYVPRLAPSTVPYHRTVLQFNF